SSATVFSPSQSPLAHRSLRRDFRSPSEMRRVWTAPSWSAWRTWSSPYAARPPSSLRISSINPCTRAFSRIKSRPLRISRDFSTLVDCHVLAPFEAPGALPTHPMLGRHLRLEVLDHLDPFAAEHAQGRFAPVDHDEAVQVLLREHLVERRGVELRVAAVEERRDGLGRLQHEGDHLRLVRPDLLVPREDDQPVRGRNLVRLEALHRRLD